ncbi:MAG TPA: S41 family peptidase [Candidatus Acidoferrales bacterium]|nr:S41 family peptidase [Candidatus Acidoferrales bacterium]
MIPIALKDRTEVFDRVADLTAKRLFAPSFDKKKWAELVQSRREQILAKETVEELEGAVRDLLAELKISHVVFFHRSLQKIAPNYAIGATFQPCQVNGTTRWMFQDVHDGSTPALAEIQPGDLLLEIDGQPVTPPEMPAFRMGGFCEIGIEKLSGAQVAVRLGVPLPKSKWHPINRPTLVSWSKPEPGIGYLKAAGFPGQVGMDVAREIDHAICELRGCDRLIVDLRGNPGGGAGGLRLMGYFTPHKLPVGYSLSRKRAEKGYQKEKLPRFGRIPSRKIELWPLVFRFAFSDKSIVMVTEGLGPQPFHGKIVLLVNQHTASAAETITGFARENKLATIVGTKTAGQVLGGTGFKVGHEFILRIPVMTFHTWNGNSLEGKGVEPDYRVELSRDILKNGKDAQLEKAIEVARQL